LTDGVGQAPMQDLTLFGQGMDGLVIRSAVAAARAAAGGRRLLCSAAADPAADAVPSKQ